MQWLNFVDQSNLTKGLDCNAGSKDSLDIIEYADLGFEKKTPTLPNG